jgi:hypothetical protein
MKRKDANEMGATSDLMARVVADVIITETLKMNPDQVVGVVTSVVERLSRQGHYDAAEIDRAVAELCRELGIPFEP